MTSEPAQVSPTALILSAWDIYRARIPLLARASLMVMALPLCLSWALVTRLFFSPVLLVILGILTALALLLIGRWTARVEEDILGGNPTTLYFLIHNPGRQTPPWNPAWLILSLIVSGVFSLTAGFGSTGLLILLSLLTPLWPLPVLLCTARQRLEKTRRPAPPSDRSPDDITYLAAPPDTSDITRPLSTLQMKYPDATVAAVSETNPSGFQWTAENRQALMMDILAGHLNLEDAKVRYGLKSEELKTWMKDFMRQDQAPKVRGRDIPPSGNTPA